MSPERLSPEEMSPGLSPEEMSPGLFYTVDCGLSTTDFELFPYK